ncbi:sodium channel protein Nach-like [Diabrotica undecimpunctata]|uniref:sodium channel protein Nach-like n=1 Tax=Diabrotica undecimpunctata TaxID=50387 RepID=UPI003B633957
MPNLHLVERLFWLLIVGTSAAGAIALTISNWTRFVANPTVISIEKDYRNWQNHIPAVTGCFNNKVDLQKAEKYIYKTWKIKPSDPKFDYYLEFVTSVTNATYINFHNFEKFRNDATLTEVDMAQLALNVHPTITGLLLTVDKSREFKWNLILTELGICFTFFAKFAKLLSIKNKENSTESDKVDDTLLFCHYLNGLCYARFDSDPTLPIKYYVHSYIEVPEISSKQHHELGKGSDMEIDYRVIETQSSPDIKYLAPSQRKCRFDDEPIRKDVPVYSISICQMGCRHNLAMKFCGCKPYFYHIFGGVPCNITGLLCLSKYSAFLTMTPSKMGCKCPQTCHFINYLPETPKIVLWDSGVYFDQRTTFRWGLLHPTTKYRRDILFGFGDLIVSFGGTLNLFVGVSFISITEAVYLIIEGVFNMLKDEFIESRNRRIINKMKKRRIRPFMDTMY